MWTNITALAQKAKEAAALIENEINDSLQCQVEEEKEEDKKDDGDISEHCSSSITRSTPNPRCDDNDNNYNDDDDGGWDNCDLSSHDGKKKRKEEENDMESKNHHHNDDDVKTIVPIRNASLKNEHTPPDKEMDNKIAMMERISTLEQQVCSLQKELALAQNTTIQLNNKIHDLEEQNRRILSDGDEKLGN